MRGLSRDPRRRLTGIYDLHAPRGGEAVQILAPEGALEGGSGFSCDVDALPPVRRDRGTSRTSGASKALTSLNTAVLAFDTDNELLNLKFADNTTTAANYVAGVVAQLNVIYERDLFVRFLQGYTVLRVSTTPDPYLATESNSEKLDEFRTYWNSNYASVQRAAVAMLSGKSASASSGRGIGYVGVLCRKTSAFTFNKVFRNGTAATANDGRLIGHEIGHNFGAGHTHNADTNPAMPATQPIDFCVADPAWNPPQGVSCPALFDITTASGAVVTGVRGTLDELLQHAERLHPHRMSSIPSEHQPGHHSLSRRFRSVPRALHQRPRRRWSRASARPTDPPREEPA